MSNRKVQLVLAFLAVYNVWGSTYLAIRFYIETLPAFSMAGVRFLTAGAVLYAWARFKGQARPTRANWAAAAVVGVLLLVGGNGAVVWAEHRVSSGLAALLVATEPFWVVLFDWLRPGGQRPSRSVVAGLVVGFAAIVVLVGPSGFLGGDPVDLFGVALLVAGAAAWAIGSLYTARGARLPQSPVLATGMQMLVGGAALFLLGTASGEWSRFQPEAVTLKSVLALLYLIVFGAIIGFTAYVYLLKNTTPARASTYAYVNPVIAVVLGWAFAGESISSRVIIAAVGIVSAVTLIIHRHGGPAHVTGSHAVPEPVHAPEGPSRPVAHGNRTRVRQR